MDTGKAPVLEEAVARNVPRCFHILIHMKELLIELDDETAEKLEQVAPARSRRRSQFIRTAIRRALWELEEQATAKAYQSRPDSGEDAYVDARVWDREDTRSLNDTDESSSKSEL